MSKRHKKKKHKNRTPLSGHAKVGSKLLPPFAQLPRMQNCSWMQQRLPEMLWAVLLTGNTGRENALTCFRSVAQHILQLPEDRKFGDITLTGLASLSEEAFADLCPALIVHRDVAQILSAMLLYEHLPGRSRWEEYLPAPTTHAVPMLMRAVGKSLFHQSQEATDCRWVRLLCTMAAGRMHMRREIGQPIVNYPNQDDQRKVRPSIRASEIQLDALSDRTYEWSGHFWEESLQKAPCLELPTKLPCVPSTTPITSDRIDAAYARVANHFLETEGGSGVDPKHDQVFGAALYTLGILKELMSIGVGNSILGRLGLRTIVECYLTLAYLVRENDPEKWRSYRVFGSGQAKLSSLKLDERTSQPRYVAQEDLDAIANEDIWDEFLSIEIGHWDKSNLRAISIQANKKDVYDTHYLWPSVFAHGHWGALRDSVFQTCGNPLHMLHRIPRDCVRFLPDVVDDAAGICSLLLGLVDREYPGLSVDLGNTGHEAARGSGHGKYLMFGRIVLN